MKKIEKTIMRESLIPEDSHVNVYCFMGNEMNLKRTEKMVFAIIYGFAKSGLSFTGSREYLAEWSACSLRTVDRALASLVKKGYICKGESHGRGIEYNVCVENLPDVSEHKGIKRMVNAERTAALS